jgi:hypothetical protein
MGWATYLERSQLEEGFVLEAVPLRCKYRRCIEEEHEEGDVRSYDVGYSSALV